MDSTACDYSSAATLPAACDYSCLGCTDTIACNYDATATVADGSCEYSSCAGCMDTAAVNYNATATIADTTCIYGIAGCTDTLACNFDATATYDDGSCFTAAIGYDCAGNCLSGTTTLYLSSDPQYCDGWYGMSYTITDVNTGSNTVLWIR
jgi:hypothetical protein